MFGFKVPFDAGQLELVIVMGGKRTDVLVEGRMLHGGNPVGHVNDDFVVDLVEGIVSGW